VPDTASRRAQLLTAERSGSIRRWAAAVRSFGGPVSRSRWQTWEIWRRKKSRFPEGGWTVCNQVLLHVGGRGWCDSFPWPLCTCPALGGELTSLFHGWTTLLGPVGSDSSPAYWSLLPQCPTLSHHQRIIVVHDLGLAQNFSKFFFLSTILSTCKPGGSQGSPSSRTVAQAVNRWKI